MKKILAAVLLTVAMTGTAIAETSRFTVSVSTPSAAVSKQSKATVVVKPGDGLKMNLEYPAKLSLTAPDGVTLEKAKLAKADARLDKAGLEFDVTYTAASAGRKTITGEIKFATCTENDCVPHTAPVTINVEAK